MLKYLMVCLLIGSLQAGLIVQTTDFARIEEENLDENALVIFDVDSTLIEAYDPILKGQVLKVFESLVADVKDRDLFREIHLQADHFVVDARSVDYVKKLQQKNVKTFALTAAPANVKGTDLPPADWRIEELQKYGFDFSPFFPSHSGIMLGKNLSCKCLPMFKCGVIFTAFHPKGEILAQFLELAKFRPSKVIFVDDGIHHVESVVSAMDKLGIECVGFHYTAATEPDLLVDLELAKSKIEHFKIHGVWLNNL